MKKDHPQCTNGLAVAINGESSSSWSANYWKNPDYRTTTVGDWIEANASEYTSILTGTDGTEPDRLNKIMGYNNTKAIECYNAASENTGWPVDAVMQIAKYAESTPAPETSSGWYLPSAKELSLLCTGEWEDNIWEVYDLFMSSEPQIENRNFINERLTDLAGSESLSDYIYWSSTELTTEMACNVYFSTGCVYSNLKHGADRKVRAVLAF